MTVHFIITCDGGSRGNHDKATESEGYGSFLIQMPNSPQRLDNHMTFGTGISNNEAEYMSLISALEHIQSSFLAAGADLKQIELTVRMDSQLVIGQLVQGWKVKAQNLIPLAVKAKALIQDFGKVTFDRISGDKMKEILGH